jgi:putative DNA primase/helicase
MGALDLNAALDRAGIPLRSYAVGRTHRAPCPSCDKGPRDDALAVTIHAPDDAVWRCHRCQWSGGWRSRGPTPERPLRPAQTQESKAHPAAGLSDYGCRIIAEGKSVTADDLAGGYLTARCSAIPRNGLLFHPSVWHPQERRAYPAMVGVITDIFTVTPISLHFTFLDPLGGKAKIERTRLYLAGHRKGGGVVRLTPDDEVTQGLVLGEGLETCLSYGLEYSGIWACLDAGNLAAFPLLSGIEALTVLVDHDEAGERAFDTITARYRAAGFTRPLDIIRIEAPTPGQDINDLVAA